ncbi:MAG: hypothetical protein ACXVJW_15295 [Acidimicrobiia bacterium]
MARFSKAVFGALVPVVAVVLFATACSSSSSADASALPNADAPRIGVAVDATVTAPSDLPTFDDGNGHGAVPPGGHYQIGVRGAQSVVTATLDDELPVDQVVTATFDTSGSPKDAGFGVVCRMKDPDNYYRLGVSNDGMYAIQRVKAGATTVLTGGGLWTRDPGIRRSPGPFTVRGECVGHTLTLFESNRQIATTRDANLDGRTAGVFVESFFEPNATVQVDALSVRAFRNRSKVTGAVAAGWDAFLHTQQVSRRCELLDARRSRTGTGTAFATRCGSVVFLQPTSPQTGARAYARILRKAGTSFATVKTLPDCSKRTGIRGPLATAGEVACIDLGGSTAVIWLHTKTGVIGVTVVKHGDRAAWKGYGRDWPPFA